MDIFTKLFDLVLVEALVSEVLVPLLQSVEHLHEDFTVLFMQLIGFPGVNGLRDISVLVSKEQVCLTRVSHIVLIVLIIRIGKEERFQGPSPISEIMKG